MYECTAYEDGIMDQFYSYPVGVVPLSNPILAWQGAIPTSILILTERDHTVAVVGTQGGHLFKVECKLVRRYINSTHRFITTILKTNLSIYIAFSY